MSTMSLPGFTADASLYTTKSYYCTIGAGVRVQMDDGVSPAFSNFSNSLLQKISPFMFVNYSRLLGRGTNRPRVRMSVPERRTMDMLGRRPMGIPERTTKSVPGYQPNVYESQDCLDCINMCDSVQDRCNSFAYNFCLVACAPEAFFFGIGYVACFGFCYNVHGGDCEDDWEDCLDSCQGVGDICCPVNCPGYGGAMCCNDNETCLNPATGLCCPAGTTPDTTQQICCDAGAIPCPKSGDCYDPNTEECLSNGTICPKGQGCVYRCFDPGTEACVSTGEVCPKNQVCGDICCTTGECIDPVNSVCCGLGQIGCGKACCDQSKDSCIKSTGECCSFQQTCGLSEAGFGTSCCPSGTICNAKNQCVKPQQTCKSGEYLCMSSDRMKQTCCPNDKACCDDGSCCGGYAAGGLNWLVCQKGNGCVSEPQPK